jgi:cytochrome c2
VKWFSGKPQTEIVLEASLARSTFGFIAAVALVMWCVPAALAQTLPGDPVAGEAAFKKCSACHRIGPGAVNRVGPVLNGVVGRTAGTYPGYKYTDAHKKSGVVWDEKSLAAYLPDPQKLIPDNAMKIGLDDPQAVANVIAYLKTYDAQGNRIGSGPAGVPAPAAPALAKVSYSNEQASSGEDTYKKNCVECHGEELRGGLLGGPPLRGVMFDQNFRGAPASALFLYISTQMPPENPGRFSDRVYAEVMAYVLQRNGYDAGAPMPANADALDKFVLEK